MTRDIRKPATRPTCSHTRTQHSTCMIKYHIRISSFCDLRSWHMISDAPWRESTAFLETPVLQSRGVQRPVNRQVGTLGHAACCMLHAHGRCAWARVLVRPGATSTVQLSACQVQKSKHYLPSGKHHRVLHDGWLEGHAGSSGREGEGPGGAGRSADLRKAAAGLER